MSNTLLQLLLQQARQVNEPQLIIADENLKGTPLNNLSPDNITLITNRFDLYEQALSTDIGCEFSDFDFSSQTGPSGNRIESAMISIVAEISIIDSIELS